MSERTCAWVEEHLPLLRYAGELSDEQSAELVAHLAGCAACQRARDALEASADALDAVGVEPADAARVAGLKDRVLTAVDARSDCPRELDMLDAPDSAHLAECATCRELISDLGVALDRVEAPALSAAAKVDLKAKILSAVDAAPACSHEVEVTADAALHADHLAECASCAELVSVGAALDRVEAPALNAAAQVDLKARILNAVDAVPACPREADVLAGAADAAHLESCADCRELSLVGAALDAVPFEAPSAERLAELRARIDAEVSEPAIASGRVIPFPFRVARAAAAVLLAGLLGFFGAEALKPTNATSALARIQQEQAAAEDLARRGDPGDPIQLRKAVARYDRVLRKAEDRADDPRFAQVALHARYERRALEALQRTTARGASETPFPQEILISNRDVIVEFPDSLAATIMIKRYEQALRFSDAAHPKIDGTSPRAPFDRPQRAEPYPRDELVRIDYDRLRQVIPVTITDHRIRQSILLQQGLHAEKVGDLLEARLLYRRALELGADTKAGQFALERLTQLG